MSSSISREGSGSRIHPRSSERGFLLVEVLIIGAILAVCAVTLASYRSMDDARVHSAMMLTASCLAEEELAFIEAKPAAYLASHASPPWLGEGTNPLLKNGTKFWVSSSVTHMTGYEGLFLAKVTVSWMEGKTSFDRVHEKVVMPRG